MEVPDLYRKLCIPEPIKAKLTEEEIRFLDAEARKMMWAAFMDAEGSIYIDRWVQSGKYDTTAVYTSVKQTTPHYCRALSVAYGGVVSLYDERDPNSRPMYQWRVRGDRACRFIKDIRPYLVDKWHQAELALELLSLRCQRGCKVPNENRLRRLEIYAEMKKLNAKGRAAA